MFNLVRCLTAWAHQHRIVPLHVFVDVAQSHVSSRHSHGMPWRLYVAFRTWHEWVQELQQSLASRLCLKQVCTKSRLPTSHRARVFLSLPPHETGTGNFSLQPTPTENPLKVDVGNTTRRAMLVPNLVPCCACVGQCSDYKEAAEFSMTCSSCIRASNLSRLAEVQLLAFAYDMQLELALTNPRNRIHRRPASLGRTMPETQRAFPQSKGAFNVFTVVRLPATRASKHPRKETRSVAKAETEFKKARMRRGERMMSWGKEIPRWYVVCMCAAPPYSTSLRPCTALAKQKGPYHLRVHEEPTRANASSISTRKASKVNYISKPHY